jgi:hypothetical protein
VLYLLDANVMIRAHTSYFDDGWAIENLHAALKLTSGHLEMIIDSLGRLTGLVEKYPVLVVECAQMICDAAPDYVELWSPDLSAILAAALGSSEPSARSAARNFIEDLGTKGRLEYRNLLKIDTSVTGTDSADPQPPSHD